MTRRIALDKLKKAVCHANLSLAARGLAPETWGNVSGIDRNAGHVVIKPSGVPYKKLKPKHMIVVSMSDGTVIDGMFRPSVDTPTHVSLYRAFDQISSIVHTHSRYATAWAQAGREIPVLGTTHADYFQGPIPCARLLTTQEIQTDYEANAGKAIIERFAELNPMKTPGVLLPSHGLFVWGHSFEESVRLAVVAEIIARLAFETLRINPAAMPVQQELIQKHFVRKRSCADASDRDGTRPHLPKKSREVTRAMQPTLRPCE